MLLHKFHIQTVQYFLHYRPSTKLVYKMSMHEINYVSLVHVKPAGPLLEQKRYQKLHAHTPK